jgi:hypothetical protein
LLILKRRIFDSNVCRGILSFAVTPEGPEMRPCARKFDGLANSLGDRAQIPLICLQFLLGRFRSSISALIPYQRTRLPCSIVRMYTNESGVIRNLRLRPFGSLAKNPLAHIGRAVNQYNAFILAVTQKSYDLNVHKSDFAQVEDYANSVIIHLSPYVADIRRLNSPTEPQARGVSARLLFNPQHWSTIPFGCGRGLPIQDHGPA